MLGELFVGVTFLMALPKEMPNEVIRQSIAEIEDSFSQKARVQMQEAYNDREACGVKKGDYYLIYYVDGLRPEYTLEFVHTVAEKLSVLSKETVCGQIENPYEELRKNRMLLAKETDKNSYK